VQSAISIRSLNHSFGSGSLRKQILFDISADLYPGEIVINTGPSGSGKTTLLTLVCGLRSVQGGSVNTLGMELNGASRDDLVRVRRNIGFIFQAHNLLGALTACQNVQLGAALGSKLAARETRKRSVEMLGLVGLATHVDKHPHQLSGGQKQRVAIARALIRQPKIVLADEPTAALDKASGREVVDLLQKLAKEQGCAILLVTHDNRILDVADRILTLEDGRVSSFTAGLKANAEQLLSGFAGTQRKGQLGRHLQELPTEQFVQGLEEVTEEFEGFLRTLDTANADATRAMLEQVMEVTAARMRDLLGAERATVYLVDKPRSLVRSLIAHHAGFGPLEIQIPIGTGIAGRCAERGESMNIDDPYAHPDFNPSFDRASAAGSDSGVRGREFRTRSILCTPILDRRRAVIGVAQLLNKRDHPAFTEADEHLLQSFTGSLGILLETCARVAPDAVPQSTGRTDGPAEESQ
jgi:putative ABC transport system ATP-binding protein